MNNLLRVLITLVVSLVLTIILCAICVGTIQLLRTLCKKLTRAFNSQRPYVVEFSGNGPRRLSYESSSDGRYDTNSLDRRDSSDVEARHNSRREGDDLDPIWTDAHNQGNVGPSQNGRSSAPVQNGNTCGRVNVTGSHCITSVAENDSDGKAVRQTPAIQFSSSTDCMKSGSVREKNDRNAKGRERHSATEDDLTIINIWAADESSSSMQQLQSRSLGRKIKGNIVMESGRKNVEEIRALDLIEYTESPRVPGRRRNFGSSSANKEILSNACTADVPSLTVTDGDASPFLSCLEETISCDDNTNADFLSPPRTPCTFSPDEINNNESFSESLNYVSAEYDFAQPTCVERTNHREAKTTDNVPLNLFDCDRVVPSAGRHYPFRHEVQTLFALYFPHSSHQAGALVSSENNGVTTTSFKLPSRFSANRTVFDSSHYERPRSASVSEGLSDECLNNLRSASDMTSSQPAGAEFLNVNALDLLLLSTPSETDQESKGLRHSNASLASTLVSHDVRRECSNYYHHRSRVPHTPRRLGLQHRYLSLDVNNLSEDPPEYNDLPPPTYIEAMLNDHLQKQQRILQKRKSTVALSANRN